MHYLEEELQLAQGIDKQWFKILSLGMQDALWYRDLEDPGQEWLNDKFWQRLGYSTTAQYPSGGPVQTFLLHPEDQAILDRAMADHLLNPQKPFSELLRFRHKDEQWLSMRYTAKVIFKDQRPYRCLGVLVDNSNNEQARIDLQRQKHLRQLLLEISAQFINLGKADYEALVDRTLAKLGEFTQADRVYIFDYEGDSGLVSNTFEWCAEGIEAQIMNLQKIPLEYFPEWIEQHFKGQSLFLPNIDELDPEQGQSKQVLQDQGIKSLLAVPILLEGRYLGFVGFDWVQEYTSFNPEEEEILRLFASMLGQWEWRVGQENELQAQQELSAQIVEELAFPVLLLSTKAEVQRYNQGFLQMLGEQSPPLLSSPAYELFAAKDKLKLELCIGRAISDGEALCAGLQLVAADKVIEVEALVKALKNADGRPRGLLFSIRDVRRDLEQQRKLVEQSKLLEALRDTSPIYIVELDEHWKLLRANQAFEALLNQSQEGLDFSEMAKDQGQELERGLVVEYKLNSAQRTVFLQWQLREEGKTRLLFGIDVTQQEHQRQQLEKKESNLLMAQSLANLGSWEENILEENFYASPTLYKIYGRSENTGFQIADRYEGIHPDDQQRVLQIRELAFEKQMEYYSKHRLSINGHIKYVEEKGIVIWSEDGAAIGLYGFTQDITNAKEQEQDLERMEMKLQEQTMQDTLRRSVLKALEGPGSLQQKMRMLQKKLGHFLGATKAAYYEEKFRNDKIVGLRLAQKWSPRYFPSAKKVKEIVRPLPLSEVKAFLESEREMTFVLEAERAQAFMKLLGEEEANLEGAVVLGFFWSLKNEKGGLVFWVLEAGRTFADGEKELIKDIRGQLVLSLSAMIAGDRASIAEQRFEAGVRLSERYFYEIDLIQNSCVFSGQMMTYLGLTEAPKNYFAYLESHLHKKDLHKVKETFHEFITGDQQQWHCDYHLRLSNNDYAIVHDSAWKIMDGQAKPVRVIGYLSDRSDFYMERKFLDNIQIFSGFALWQLDPETQRVRHSKNLNSILERPLQTSIQLGNTRIMAWDPRAAKWSDLSELVLDNINDISKFHDKKIKIRTEKGTEKWLRIMVEEERIKEKVIRYYGLIEDVTAQWRCLSGHKENSFWLKEVQRKADVGYFVMNLKTEQWEASEYVYSLLALPTDYPRSFSAWLQLLLPSYRAMVQAQLETGLKGPDESLTLEYQARSLDGRLLWLQVEASLKFDQQQEPELILGTLHNISREKRYLESIENQNKHLKEIAWRQYHGVRAPMARIMAVLQELGNEETMPAPLSAELREALGTSVKELDQELHEVEQKIQYTDVSLIHELNKSDGVKPIELKVLLVDDDRLFLKLGHRLVEKSGLSKTVMVFDKPLEAKEYLESNMNLEHKHYLIFLDINMPEFDGWDFLDFIESFPSKERCFVIMLSSSSDREDMQRAYRYNRVYEYLVKPLSLGHLESIRALGVMRPFFDKLS